MWTQKPRFSHFLKLSADVPAVHAVVPGFKDKVGFPELRSSLSPETMCSHRQEQLLGSEKLQKNKRCLSTTPLQIYGHSRASLTSQLMVWQRKERSTIPKLGQKERLAVSIEHLTVTSKLHPRPFAPRWNSFDSLAAPQKVWKVLKLEYGIAIWRYFLISWHGYILTHGKYRQHLYSNFRCIAHAFANTYGGITGRS